ncbi:MAG: GTP cyclohydrolase IIa [Candidatus Helarchaeales archaeon]
MIQITLIQLDNFGPFTETLGDDREHDVQMILARAYYVLQDLFSKMNGLVFQVTLDNMIAITNGISLEEHRYIMDQFEKKLKITCSMGIGVGTTPLEAQEKASLALQQAGSAQSSRRKVLVHDGILTQPNGAIKIAHVDVNDFTVQATDRRPIYENYYRLNRSYLTLMEAFQRIGALCFFNGGDNFITICPENVKPDDLKEIINEFERLHDPWKLKVGIGTGHTAKIAMCNANKGLSAIRKRKIEDKIVSVE